MRYQITLKLLIFLFFILPNASAEIIYTKKQFPLDSLVNGRIKFSDKNRPRIGLVLSGGGARGIAHVGVLKAIEKHKIPIDLIVGSSIGSIIGGLYSCGYSADQLEKIVKEIGWDDLFQDETQRENLFLGQKMEDDRYLLNIRFDGYRPYIPSSLTPGQKLLSILSKKVLMAKYQATNSFDQLKIPFRAVATDLISGHRIVFEQGDLAEAINASSAVPLLFSPVETDGMMLIDGGISTNVPVDVARNMGMDIVIAVDITSHLRTKEDLKAPWEIADQVITIMMRASRIEQLKLADIIVKPNLEGLGSADFDKIQEMINNGESSFNEILHKLYSIIDNKIPLVQNLIFPYNNFELQINKDCTQIPDTTLLYANSNYNIDLDKIKEDVDHLFSTGHIKEISVEYKILNNDTTLIYFVTSNQNIDSVKYSGNTVFPDSLIHNILVSDSSSTYNYDQLLLNFEVLRDYYRARGYSLMKIDSISYDEQANILNIRINEGRLDSIVINGNEITEDIIISREFNLSKGDLFNAHVVNTGIENIYNTQLFDRVGVRIGETNNKNRLSIKVKEKKFTVLKFGGKIDNERGIQSYLKIANENFLGRGNNISFIGRFGEMDRLASLNFRSDRIFESYFTFSLHGYYNWELNPFYNGIVQKGMYLEERRGGRIIFGQQFKKLGQLSIELRLENAKDKQYSNTFDRGQNSELRTLRIRSVADKRDKIGFTTEGIYNIWYWESGNERIFEGQESYTKAFINLEGYFTNWVNHTLHVRFIGGFADQTLPFSEYFRIGGLNSFMGSHEKELTGRQIIVTNLEYRFKFPFRIITDTYLGLRYDIGAFWETPDLVFEGKDFFYGSGMWIGFDTLLGPLQFGYGKKASDSGIFYATLGYEF